MKIITLLTLFLLFGCTSYQQAFTEKEKTLIQGKLVVISDYGFHPETITISLGETITWKNLDKDAHSLKYQNNVSKLLEKDETFSLAPTEQGVFDYRSGNHPFIKGRVIVQTT